MNATNYILNLECREPFLHQAIAIPTIVGEVDLELEFTVYGSYYPETWESPAEYPEIDDITIVSATCYTTDYDGKFTGNSFKLNKNQFKFIQVYLQEKHESYEVEQACWDAINCDIDY